MQGDTTIDTHPSTRNIGRPIFLLSKLWSYSKLLVLSSAAFLHLLWVIGRSSGSRSLRHTYSTDIMIWPPHTSRLGMHLIPVVIALSSFSFLTEAIPWPGVGPTPIGQVPPAYLAWTPRPTAGPELRRRLIQPRDLFGRQASSRDPRTCGYVNGNHSRWMSHWIQSTGRVLILTPYHRHTGHLCWRDELRCRQS